ncbi:hypothetical protein M427DRAFT_279686 [Gonapodya prolifera JEL478]|uniref:Uncharacterized protein n=1 Tax=Gonapodya prolifera (strain JEL478) TaxID=1344416 RepID=A0A139AYL0_GONPJ|nr:hypothetical protein M427DRAFT_279686 [Gonapodya prolifera JEL478]|eukprot:KXS21831.1 hypothetical protein M427DRAFT_279686 [Gonapodya prolifera JEL478]
MENSGRGSGSGGGIGSGREPGVNNRFSLDGTPPPSSRQSGPAPPTPGIAISPQPASHTPSIRSIRSAISQLSAARNQQLQAQRGDLSTRAPSLESLVSTSPSPPQSGPALSPPQQQLPHVAASRQRSELPASLVPVPASFPDISGEQSTENKLSSTVGSNASDQSRRQQGPLEVTEAPNSPGPLEHVVPTSSPPGVRKGPTQTSSHPLKSTSPQYHIGQLRISGSHNTDPFPRGTAPEYENETEGLPRPVPSNSLLNGQDVPVVDPQKQANLHDRRPSMLQSWAQSYGRR